MDLENDKAFQIATKIIEAQQKIQERWDAAHPPKQATQGGGDQGDLAETVKTLREEIAELRTKQQIQEQVQQEIQKQKKFDFSSAVQDWIADREAAADPEKAMQATYDRGHEVDAKGWPVRKPAMEIPDELLQKAQDAAKKTKEHVEKLMRGGRGPEPEE